jgi:hypothetical protein
MTSDDRIDKLEKRVDRHEDNYKSDITALHSKIDTLVTMVNAAMVRAAKAECPSPGTCLTLSPAVTAMTARVERLELRLLSMEKWRGWITGIGAALVIIVTLFGPSIRHALRLP